MKLKSKGGAESSLGLIQFDLDGTLLDTYAIILDSMQHTVNGVYKKSYSDAELMKTVGIPLSVQMHEYVPEDPEGACDEYRRYQKSVTHITVQAFEGIEQLLQQLKSAGFKLAVITSKMHGPAQSHLSVCGILSYFDLIVGADDVEKTKPDPYPILYGASLLNTPLQQVTYVGDSPFDLQAANGAGVFSIAVEWGMFSAEILNAESPYFCVNKPHEILQAVSEIYDIKF